MSQKSQKNGSKYIPPRDESVARLSRADLSRLASLKRKKGRRQEGQFLAEGVRALEEALKFHRTPERIYCYPPGLGERGERLIAAFKARNVPIQVISSRDLHRLADTEQPQGVVAVFPLPDAACTPGRLTNVRRALVLENIADPGNAGALIRSAVGFGFDPILLLGQTVEAFNPKVLRSSAGAVFGATVLECDLDQLTAWKKASGALVLVTDLAGEREENWRAPAPGRPLALVICSEGAGASPEIVALADQRIRITHGNRIESLNAAFAGAIAMHRIYLADKEIR
ncbi:MAG TPA: RNA methyltransferase [candidate division Zixibacteria bacterium]|nr:RNA methyltransferase [candidate division Zixibacteria bacterium]